MNGFHEPPKSVAETKAEFEREFRRWEKKCRRAFKAHPRIKSAGRGFVKRLMGSSDSFPALIASNAVVRSHFVGCLFQQTKAVFNRHPEFDFLQVTIIHGAWATTDERGVVRLHDVQKFCRRLLEKISPDFIGGIELQAFANVKTAGGMLLGPHVHAVVFGENLYAKARAIAKAANAVLPELPGGLIPVAVDRIGPTELDLCRVLRYPYKACSKRKTQYINGKTGESNFHESEAGDRFVRYLRMLEIYSQVELSRLVFGGGKGADLRRRAIKKTSSKFGWSSSSRKTALQLSEIAQQWSEFRDLGVLKRFDPVRIV